MIPCAPIVLALDPAECKRRLEKIADMIDRQRDMINAHLLRGDMTDRTKDWFAGTRDGSPAG